MRVGISRNADSIRRFAAILKEDMKNLWASATIGAVDKDGNVPIYRSKTIRTFLDAEHHNPYGKMGNAVTLYRRVYDKDLHKEVEIPVVFHGTPSRWTVEEFVGVLRPNSMVRG